MLHIRTVVALLFASMFLTPAVPGQRRVPESTQCTSRFIESGLASKTALDIAWAAWCAGGRGNADGKWSPGLRRALAHAISLPADNETRRLIAVLIDALWRTRAVLPVQEAVALHEHFPDAAVALIAGYPRDPQQEVPSIMALLRQAEKDQNRPRWLALASTLQYSRELKRHLAEQVRFEYSINVDDRDMRPIQLYPRPPSGVIGGVPSNVPDEWPSVPSYRLANTPQPGIQALVTSSFAGDVFLVRSDHPGDPSQSRSTGWEGHRKDVLWMLYPSAHCILCSGGPRTRPYPNVLGGGAEVTWRSPEQFRRVLVETVQRYTEECAAFLAALGEGEWSTEQVSSKVSIVVSDQRADRSVPLPELGGVVRVVSR